MDGKNHDNVDDEVIVLVVMLKPIMSIITTRMTADVKDDHYDIIDDNVPAADDDYNDVYRCLMTTLISMGLLMKNTTQSFRFATGHNK